MAKTIQKSIVLPVLALRGLMTFPHMVLHFDVGRVKSVAALEQAMMENQKIFLVCQKNEDTEEPESTNTKENIGNSLQFIDANDRIGIVTNNYHVFRGVGVARKAGLKNVCGISADSAPRYLPNNMLREFFGVVKYFLVGDI